MPTPKKLTLADAQEALRRLAQSQGPTPQLKQLSPQQIKIRTTNAELMKGVLQGVQGSDEQSVQRAAQVGGGVISGIPNLSIALRRKLFPEETPPIPEFRPLGVLKDALWGSPNKSIWNPSTYPGVEAIGGGPLNLGKAFVSGLWDSALNAGRVVSPNVEDQLYNRSLGERLTRTIPFVGPSLEEHYNEVLEHDPSYVQGDRNPEAQIGAALGAVAQTGSELIGSPLMTAFSGRISDPTSPTGDREATPVEKSAAIIGSFFLAKQGRGLLAKTGRPNIITTLEGDSVETILRKNKAQTVGEMQGLDFLKKMDREARKEVYPQPAPPAGTPEVVLEGAPGGTPSTSPIPEIPTPKPAIPKGPKASQYPIAAGPEFDELYDTLGAELKQTFSVEGSLPPEVLKDYTLEILTNPLKNKMAQEFVMKGDPVGAAMVKTLQSPEFQVVPTRLMEQRGLSPAEAQKVLSGSFENATHYSGQTLNVLSEALDEWERSLTPPPEGAPLSEMTNYQSQVRAYNWWKDHNNLPQFWRDVHASQKLGGTLTKGAQNLERLRVAMTLTELPTTIHVIKAQGYSTLTDFFDAFNTGLTSTILEPSSLLDATARRNNWADVYGYAATLMKGPKTMEILEANPMVKGRLVSSLMGESDTMAGFYWENAKRMAKDAWNAPPGQAGAVLKQDLKTLQDAGHFTNWKQSVFRDAPLAAADVMTLALRAQEIAFRKFAFRTRLEGNLRRLGVKSADFLERAKRTNVLDEDGAPLDVSKGVDALYKVNEAGEKIPQRLRISDAGESISPAEREALVDAEIHALRSTWAATPDGLLGSMLQSAKLFNSVSPVQTSTLISPFLRAMANNVMWQLHHNPANVADLFLPEYRAAFDAVGRDKIGLRESRDIQRKMGQALSGLGLLTASLNMAQGGRSGGYRMGPKPWIWTTGESEGAQQTFDISMYPQLAESSMYGAMIAARLRGEPNPVSLKEFSDIAANTRLGQVPLFRFAANLGRATQDEGKWNAFYQELGQWIAPFGNIPQTLREDYGRMTLEGLELATTGEVTGAQPHSADYTVGASKEVPILGPFTSKTIPSLLPTQVSPFTGEPVQDPSAIAANSPLTFTAPMKRMEPMEWLLTATPGFTSSSITKSYKNNEAQQLVNRFTGQLVSGKPIDGGSPLLLSGVPVNQFVETLNSLNDPDISRMWLNTILPIIHDVAEKAAMKYDMEMSGASVPPHFVNELVKTLPTEGVPNLSQYWEQLLKARATAPRTSPTPPLPFLQPKGPQVP